MTPHRYIVAISGASGTLYGIRLVEALLALPAVEIHLIVSPAAVRVMREELDRHPKLSPFDPHSLFTLGTEQAERITLHNAADIGAGPASGTFRAAAMIICPASVKTLAAVAHGYADNLITRAADVSLKESRPLIIVPRETPFSTIHLRNMLALSEAGATILPACPAFYHKPQTIEDLVSFITQKIFDRLNLDSPDAIRWKDNQDH